MSVHRLTKNVLARVVTRATPAALVLAAALLAAHAGAEPARAAGPAAEGSVRFSTADGATRTLQFSAATNDDGRVEGGMTFSGPAEIPEQDVDGAGYEGFTGAVSNLVVEARFDGFAASGGRAVMSGRVTASNLGEYIGRRVLLVVEDNGAAGGDKVSWGLYRPVSVDWTPTDYERRGEDNGWSLTWTATDHEREDDRGVHMPLSTDIDCRTFPLAAHDFLDTRELEGDIVVRQ